MNSESVQNFITENLFAIAVGGGAVFLLISVWLILRRVRLWYWRTSERADAILEIDKRLASMDENLKMLTYCGGGKVMQSQYGITTETVQSSTEESEEPCEKAESEAEPEAMPIIKDEAETADQTQDLAQPLCYTSRDCGRAKDGRVYTIEEIENNIRD